MPTRATDSGRFEIETFGHFQYRQFGDIPIRLLTEDFRQKNDVIENLASHALFTRVHYPGPFRSKKKALHRMTDERLCSTRASLLSSTESAIVMPASGAKNRCNFSDFFKSAARLPRGESGCA
jgi:hypothetical protein